MTDINNKKDFKEINVVDNNLSINAVNNSILIDDKKTLNLVKQVVAQRGVNSRVRYDIPESFDMISESTFSKIQEIDKIHRANIISRDIAIEMIADLFEGEAIRTEFEKHIDNLYLEKLKKLYPDRIERLKHIFEKQVYGLAPTEIIYRIAIAFILGFDDTILIKKHNLRQFDTLPSVQAGTLETDLDEVFG